MSQANLLNGLYIDGQWHAGSELLPVINPSTEEPLALVAGGDRHSVEQAVTAAQAGLAHWAAASGAERGAVLRRIAAGVAEHRERLMHLQSSNNGKPQFEAAIDVDDVIATFEYYAGLAEGLDAAQDRDVPLPSDDFSARVRREPCGVVGLIVPWNFPMVTTAWKLAPALAAGCSVVLKPSEVTPLPELELAAIIARSGLPKGVFNLVCGTGLAVGAPLAADPRVAKISFTGSNAVGVQVMQRAAETVKGVSLELGGKSSLLVLADADLELAVELACGGGFFNAGQMCSATSRVLVADELADEFLLRLKARAEAIRVADPFEPDVEMGALVNQAQYQRVLGHIDRGLSVGAKLVCGGERPTDRARGFFVRPTIFTEVPLDSALWREEIFGPVLCVRSFASEAEAIALANDSEFGLVASVVSADLDNAERVANALQAGLVWINAPQVIFPQTAWGGYKQSSIGRELGPWGLQAFQEIKHVVRAR
ncbi:aldehyde dehydrogenase family protein [Pseudomonas chlororaphis]|uniref:aldehyde dehydrogenase family protein n=1 Tax=Pseudomonas chlororaphis TaxID=587753 RepID=UPI000F56A533|nr:aldehyde dehydrogenase family protein [Pseudomonas chlororaphis]AZC52848.1 Betaine-aldehyde dehydrogenase, putative [Pseudomonas chlororaphis subsp. piscium]AZC71556.1 Betaine-aldehyde dehydrogenase, putative [Pseudomonas chlororaphis subsp. piscium]AZC77789.1 Betaine-aldehyde dehydrogenase, putative [Pseudomonas chlororaphis subsp. piscium]AZC84111.1 Betaine-aldehyde dehydrogenase, putative [Pseudomonas chlororaphis subsp. piscium]MBP5057528.1 aldehyde dehydrogenase family protein [Pseudom